MFDYIFIYIFFHHSNKNQKPYFSTKTLVEKEKNTS